MFPFVPTDTFFVFTPNKGVNIKNERITTLQRERSETHVSCQKSQLSVGLFVSPHSPH